MELVLSQEIMPHLFPKFPLHLAMRKEIKVAGEKIQIAISTNEQSCKSYTVTDTVKNNMT